MDTETLIEAKQLIKEQEENISKQISRKAFQVGSKALTAEPEQFQNLLMAMLLLNQAQTLVESNAGESRRLFSLALRFAR